MNAAQEQSIAQELARAPKPIAVMIPNRDIQMLFMSDVSQEGFMQCILAKLKDAGAPVEGVLKLRLAHGKVAKLKDDVLKPEEGFTYMWLPDEYVAAIASGNGGVA